MPDPLQEGLRRHYWIIGRLSLLMVDDPPKLIEFSKRIDELIAAVAVDLLEKCDTEEKRLAEIKKIRAAFEKRWEVILDDPLSAKPVDVKPVQG